MFRLRNFDFKNFMVLLFLLGGAHSSSVTAAFDERLNTNSVLFYRSQNTVT